MKALGGWLDSTKQNGDIVNIDGKRICGSADENHRAYHVVSAWVSERQFTLGQVKTEEKSNEITAIPELLDLIDVSGTTVTIDAGGCHKSIAEKITEKGADYALALKGNQGTLHEDVKLYFENKLDACKLSVPLEKGHGRIERREYLLCEDIAWLYQKPAWANRQAIGAVVSHVENMASGEEYSETRYYITSLTNVEQFARAVCAHWSIENQLHWSRCK